MQTPDAQKKVQCSISPAGIIVAFRDDTIASALEFLNSLRAHSPRVPGFSAVLTMGKLRKIEKSQWLSENVEGGEVIAACRILAKLTPEQFAYTKQIIPHHDFKNGYICSFPGKRKEVFEAYVVSDYFRRPDLASIPITFQAETVPSLPRDTIQNAIKTLPGKQQTIPFPNQIQSEAKCSSLPVPFVLGFSGLEKLPSIPFSHDFGGQNIESFSLNAMIKVVRHEIGLWKQFHSVIGPLAHYCDTAYGALNNSEQNSTNDRLEKIKNLFKIQLQAGNPDFFTLCMNLKNDGFVKLIESLKSVGIALEEFDCVHALDSLISPKIVNPVDFFDKIENATNLLGVLKDKALLALPSDLPHLGLIRKFILDRTRSSQIAIQFTAAIICLEKYLDGYFVRIEHSIPELTLVRDSMFKKIAEQIKPQNYNLVVSTSNIVIFDWIDLLTLMSH